MRPPIKTTIVATLFLWACSVAQPPSSADGSTAPAPKLMFPGYPDPFVIGQVSAKSLQYQAEVDAGNSGAAITINWLQGQDQQVLLTATTTFTFTAPLGVSTRLLRLIQDGAGSHTVTWPASVKWPGGTAPTLTTAAGGTDIVSCFYNGSANYDCQAALNFQ